MNKDIISIPRKDSRATNNWGMCPDARFGWIFEYPKVVKVVTLK